MILKVGKEKAEEEVERTGKQNMEHVNGGNGENRGNGGNRANTHTHTRTHTRAHTRAHRNLHPHPQSHTQIHTHTRGPTYFLPHSATQLFFQGLALFPLLLHFRSS